MTDTQTGSVIQLKSDEHQSENVLTDSSDIIFKNKILTDTNSNQSKTIKHNSYDNINTLNLGLKRKGMNIGHLNLQGMNSKQKFSELSLMLTSKNNNIHVLGISETKLNSDTFTDSLKINGYKTPFRKDHL